MKDRYKVILKSLFPALLFMMLYKVFSFQMAIVVGLISGVALYSHQYYKHRKLTFFDRLGIFSLVVQSVAGFMISDPKSYFYYPVLENAVFAVIVFASLFMKRDIIATIAMEMNQGEDSVMLRSVFRQLTFLWGCYYLLRTVVKVVGILSWSFDQLYTVNWVLGTPLMTVLIWFSFHYPEKTYNRLVTKNASNE